ncbi:acyltransferase domain-containing protein, partial [Streptomyces bambusae]
SGAAAEGASAPAGGHAPADSRAVDTVPPRKPLLFPVSGRGESALRAQAGRLGEYVGGYAGAPEALAYALAGTRTAYEDRAVVVAEDLGRLAEGLDALAAGTGSARVVQGRARAGRTAFLFSGQGSQRPGMGRELHAAQPVFAAAFDEACAALDAHLPRPLREIAFAGPGTDEALLLDRTAWTQPALFAFEVAAHRLLEHLGVRPDFVVGHSIGELAAAHVAGVLSLADAAALVAARGRLMDALPEGGAMAALQATEDEVEPLLADHAGRVCVAAVNGPRSVVVSGDAVAVAALTAHFAGRGRKTKQLRVSHAFHSAHMDGMLDEFRAVAASLTYHPARLPVVSNLTGAVVADAEIGTADYWVRHVREAVRFADGIRALDAEGVTTYVELGPDGALSSAGRECAGEDAAFVPLARTGKQPEPQAFAHALARLHTLGAADGLDWAAVLGASAPAPRLELPTYAFQRRRHWIDAAAPAPATTAHAPAPAPAEE